MNLVTLNSYGSYKYYCLNSFPISHGLHRVLPGKLKKHYDVRRKAKTSTKSELFTAIAGVTAVSVALPHTAMAISMDSVVEGAANVYTLADGSFGDLFGNLLFSSGQQANEAVQGELSALSFSSLAVIFGAGLVTSLSPCTLSVLPLTMGYIGAFGSGKSRAEIIGNSVSFAMGLATTLAVLGIAASFAGKAYGQIGQGLPIAASGLAVFMGLNLLEIIELQLPSFFDDFDPRAAAANFPSSVQAYLAGLTFALAASPCSTPVLASLLAYVATSKDPVVGGSLLLTYTTGYVAPLLIAASFAGALQLRAHFFLHFLLHSTLLPAMFLSLLLNTMSVANGVGESAVVSQVLSMDQPDEWCALVGWWDLYYAGQALSCVNNGDVDIYMNGASPFWLVIPPPLHTEYHKNNCTKLQEK